MEELKLVREIMAIAKENDVKITPELFGIILLNFIEFIDLDMDEEIHGLLN